MLLLIPIAVFLILLFLCAQWKGGWRVALLPASLAMGVVVFALTETLSLLNAVTPFGMGAVWGVVLAVLLVIVVRFRARWKPVPLNLRLAAFSRMEQVLLAGVVALVLVNAAAAIQAPPNNWDAMVYHLPRVMHWLANRNVNFYATHINRQLFLNPGMEYLLLQVIGLGGGDRWVNFTGIVVWLGGALMASLLAREIGAERRAQWLAAGICLLIPTSILQAGTPKNDLLLGYWVLAAFTAAFQFQKQPTRVSALQLGAAIGLAVLAKTTALVFLAPLVVWFIVWGLRALKNKLWRYGLLISLVVVLLAAPHMLRSSALYGSPLGPKEETAQYSNAVIGMRVLVSNTLRNLALHLRGPQGWNDFLLRGLDRLHTWMGISLSDPRTTWTGYTFDLPPLRINEDDTGAPLHLVLSMLVLALLALRWKQGGADTKTAGLLALLILAAFLLFSVYLRWQLWQVRLMISLMMSASVVIGWALAQVKVRWLAPVVMALMILMGGVCLWQNPTKPLPGLYDFNIVNLKRSLVMVYDLSIQPDMMAVVETLDRDLHCNQVGLILDNSDWEYPLWALLGKTTRLEHVLVENASARLAEAAFTPCAVLVMTEDRPVRVELPSGGVYTPYLELPQLTLYVP
ncbi:MAG: phospholipid carrier-dependent glycosyltransferase [Anaerolineae bacterium]|nr:phospholipid carrier-dependent glycosyltransferase [Anaerolineae bacterium]